MVGTLGVSQGPPLGGLWGAISTPLALRDAGAVLTGTLPKCKNATDVHFVAGTLGVYQGPPSGRPLGRYFHALGAA